MQTIVMNVVLLILLIKMMIYFDIAMRKLIKTKNNLNIWVIYLILIIINRILNKIMIFSSPINSTYNILNIVVVIGLSMFITTRILYCFSNLKK